MQITITCGGGISTNWWPIVVGGLQFFIGIAFTVYSFSKNYKQKADERRASWYHKVVVDKAIGLLDGYLVNERAEIETSALACQSARSDPSDASSLDSLHLEAVADFQRRLRPVRADLTNLALIFDHDLFKSIQAITLEFDDAVSRWFYLLKTEGALKMPKMISEIMSDFHRDILRALRDYEFLSLPKSK